MPRPPSEQPTELELQLLKILWEQSPQPVREIRDALAQTGRDIAHTSVITTLNTMVEKGFLLRARDGKAFLFSPAVTRDAVSEQMLGQVVHRVFDGSASAVMLSLLNTADLDDEELRLLRRMVNRRMKGQEE
ncbi:MAG: BlaI/MecI/CopY family transcriptional regulator [Planctomycetaceae bacterium]|nr:BlaI/MecI/CopY family transcriptional regulator [Planctomycetaceae bacterium]